MIFYFIFVKKNSMEKSFVKHEFFIRKVIFFLFFMRVVFLDIEAQPTLWYFSSSTGNDNNTGTSPSSPWKSMTRLQQLLNGQTFNGKKLQRGDTIYFFRGDTFRTSVITPTSILSHISINSTVATSPGSDYITLRDYGNSSLPKPSFRSTLRLDQTPSGSVTQQGNLVKISNVFLPYNDFVITRIFYKGKPLTLARFPNDSTLLVDSSKVSVIGSSTVTEVWSQQSGIISDAYVQNAVCWITISGYSWGISRVLSKSNTYFKLNPFGNDKPLRGNRFYFENKKEFMDNPGEWFYDVTSDTLYILLPQSANGIFNKSDYEVYFTRFNTGLNEFRNFVISSSTGYSFMPSNPPHHFQFLNLSFDQSTEAIRIAGAKDINIMGCDFNYHYRAIWIFLAEEMNILNNTFKFNELICIDIGGRTPEGYEGIQASITKKIKAENNLIKYTGWNNRWRNLPMSNPFADAVSYIQEDYSIRLGYNVDKIVVSKNRIDSVSQGGIVGTNFYYTLPTFASQYPGSIPFIIEKNYITNFCSDFSDCGGIKLFCFLNGSIVRNNILVKDIYGKDNRDKSWLADYRFTLTHYGGNGYGLYSDVRPHSAVFENNTVVGCDINNSNHPGGGDIKNIISRKNTFYGATVKEIDFVSESNANNKIDSCQIEENLFFHLGHGDGAIRVQDASNNNIKDTVWIINKNRYFSPNYSPHIYQTVNGSQHIYGSLKKLQSMGYESSPNSYFGDWAKFRYWSNNNVVTFTGADISASNFTSTPWPAYGTGGAQVTTVSTGPVGVSVRITCTNVTSSSGAAIYTHSTQPIYTQTLSPHEVYKITLMISSAKKKDLYGYMSFNMKHPKTGDQLSGRDHFVFPVKQSYQLDTFEIYYKPRLYQYNNSFRIFLEKNDTIWIKNLKIERIDTSTIKDIRFYYPIFVNPSDNPATFSLQPCYVYLDTDSNLVVGSVTVAPWSSRILIFQKCDSLLLNVSNSSLISSDRSILVYPNPVRDQIHIFSTIYHDFEVLDIHGKVLLRGHADRGESIQSLEGLASGVYIYRAIPERKNSRKPSDIYIKIIKTD